MATSSETIEKPDSLITTDASNRTILPGIQPFPTHRDESKNTKEVQDYPTNNGKAWDARDSTEKTDENILHYTHPFRLPDLNSHMENNNTFMFHNWGSNPSYYEYYPYFTPLPSLPVQDLCDKRKIFENKDPLFPSNHAVYFPSNYFAQHSVAPSFVRLKEINNFLSGDQDNVKTRYHDMESDIEAAMEPKKKRQGIKGRKYKQENLVGKELDYLALIHGQANVSLYAGEQISNEGVDKAKQKRQKHVQKACIHCKKAHLACDTNRPCVRCVRLGKTDCVDVEHKRRGRPKANPEKKKADIACYSVFADDPKNLAKNPTILAQMCNDVFQPFPLFSVDHGHKDNQTQ
ncbi:hypothetical protein ROZALSC1DRAFT_29385 [Rozella allomycis CSF55]|uniref:Zn(2)-C6 fungal-type domain-containing protein n=1 Tax=Rozella allomycis (strain CSF55) TaxID=988480 RepID=A0A4V1IZR4_ROZAC|nr:hypothetical protein ROZALSC1DRAFT_29385 [Rozella allomycis CSF55]